MPGADDRGRDSRSPLSGDRGDVARMPPLVETDRLTREHRGRLSLPSTFRG